MTQKELGLALDSNEPIKEGVVMAMAFLVGAIVPITPWFLASVKASVTPLGLNLSPALLISVGVTVATLFVLGAGKAWVARSSIIKGGLEIMGIGILAATFGYLLGTLIPHLAGARVGS